MTQVSQPFFSKTHVDLRSRKSMIGFLKDHYKYNTMNSWNGVESFANKVKIHSLGLSREEQDKAYEFLDVEEGMYFMSRRIDQFTEKHDGRYTIGSNGRSGGYLVLYSSEFKMSEVKSRCRSCGQTNFCTPLDFSKMSPTEQAIATKIAKNRGWSGLISNLIEQPEIASQPGTAAEKTEIVRKYAGEAGRWISVDNRCGRCGADGERGRYPWNPRELSVHVGRSVIPGDGELDEMSTGQLKRLVRLVKSFDECCDLIREDFIEALSDNDVEEITISVPKKVKVLRPAA